MCICIFSIRKLNIKYAKKKTIISQTIRLLNKLAPASLLDKLKHPMPRILFGKKKNVLAPSVGPFGRYQRAQACMTVGPNAQTG